MYKAIIRAMVRRNVDRLNAGDASPMLKMAASDVVIRFPGDNSWARMFRPVVKSRNPHATHRGIDECRAFANRFTEHNVQFTVEDIMVNGGPWNCRVALRVRSHKAGPHGTDEYNNRAIAVLEIRWGKIVVWEDYEDTERVAAWDAATSGSPVSGSAVDTFRTVDETSTVSTVSSVR
jgi:ketosteroid isomerase-like protein